MCLGVSDWHRGRLPLDLWSVGLQYGYIGCFSGLTVDSVRFNVAKIVREQEVVGGEIFLVHNSN